MLYGNFRFLFKSHSGQAIELSDCCPFFVLGTTGIVPEKTVEPGNYSTGKSENTCKIGPLDDRF